MIRGIYILMIQIIIIPNIFIKHGVELPGLIIQGTHILMIQIIIELRVCMKHGAGWCGLMSADIPVHMMPIRI